MPKLPDSIGIKISELGDAGIIKENDVVPINAKTDAGVAFTKATKINDLRQTLGFENAFLSVDAGLDATVSGDVFFVYESAAKLWVLQYQNVSGVANPVLGYDNNQVRLPTNRQIKAAANLSETLANDIIDSVEVNNLHITNAATVPFIYYLSKYPNAPDATLAIIDAAASGKTVLFPYDGVYTISSNDIKVSPFTSFVGPDGGYCTFLITSNSGQYGTFDLRENNGLTLNGRTAGKFNIFRNLLFRFPNQVNALTTTVTSPIAYLPIFYGGAYESRFEHLDIGNCYIGFWLGGDNLGSASRVTLRDIIGTPLSYGLSLEHVRDVPVIANIRWNYNYLDPTIYKYDSTMKEWMRNNGIAFQFGRCDWSTCINLFAFGYYRFIYMRSTRYTGSADRMRFIGCFADMTLIPLELRNFTTRVDFENCGFTGSAGSTYPETQPSKNLLYNVGDASASVNFINTQFNNYSGDAIRTGCHVNFINCAIYAYGSISTAADIKNGILLTSPATNVTLVNTTIDGSGGSYTRCVSDNDAAGGVTHGSNRSELTVSSGSKMIGATSEIFRWNNGIENIAKISHDSTISAAAGVNGRTRVSFISAIPKVEYGSSMPTTGTYTRGDYVWNTAPTSGGSTGSKYIVKGWIRLVTGNSHVLNTDWSEDRAPNGI